jgi:serine/threonine protein kinase
MNPADNTPETKFKLDVILGLIAAQFRFVPAVSVSALLAKCVPPASANLASLLKEEQGISSDSLELLIALRAQYLNNHDNDVDASIAALDSNETLRTQLLSLVDPQMQATLTLANAGDPTRDLDATQFYSDRTNESDRSTKKTLHSVERYRIIRPHAKGGLGEVYLARDAELQREVALKEIQPRFADNSESRARFRLEAEVTGNLEHPGIVPVYGLGHYGDGRPFYAMRFIRGDSLKEAITHFHTKYPSLADSDAALELRKLLGRFIDVCNAIEYAHSRGVLHRDLKPGNIVLGSYGETLVVDWGLAKVLGATETASEVASQNASLTSSSGASPTIMGSAVGTPAYMPPEQASGNLAELGPSSDVYSLGATLYHLLTGKPPFSGSTVAQVLSDVQQGKFVTPRSLRPDLPLQLAAICEKAMATSPQSRYQTPLLLAEDIDRYLADEPVSAIPDPWITRSKRWLRKHPGLAGFFSAAIAVGSISLVGGIAILSNKNAALQQAIDAESAAREAESLAKTVALNNEKIARKQQFLAENRLLQVEKGTQLLASIFADLDPDSEERERRPLRDILADRVFEISQSIDQNLAEDPLVAASLKRRLGVSLVGLGRYDAALKLTEEAFKAHQEKLPESDSEYRESLSAYAFALAESGDSAQALPLFEKLLVLNESHFGTESLEYAQSLSGIASSFHSLGKPGDAIPLFEKALDIAVRLSGPDSLETIATTIDLANTLGQAEQRQRSLELLRQGVQKAEASLGTNHIRTLTYRNSLAAALLKNGDFNEAVEVQQKLAADTRSNLGPKHPDTSRYEYMLAQTLIELGEPAQALQILERSAEELKALIGEDHPDTLRCRMAVSTALEQLDRLDEAADICRDNIERFTRVRGENHPDTFGAINNYSLILNRQQRYDESAKVLQDLLSRERAELGDDHPKTFATRSNLALALRSNGQRQEASEMLRELLDIQRIAIGPDHRDSLKTMSNLAAILNELGETEQAFELYRENIELQSRRYGDDAPGTIVAKSNFAFALWGKGQRGEAITVQQQAMEALEARNFTPPQLAGFLVNLFTFQETEKLYADAEKWRRHWLRLTRERTGVDSDDVGSELVGLGVNLIQQMKFAEAEIILSEALSIRKKISPTEWTTSYVESLLGESLLRQDKPAEAEPLLISGAEGLYASRDMLPQAFLPRLQNAVQLALSVSQLLGRDQQISLWKERVELISPPQDESSQN